MAQVKGKKLEARSKLRSLETKDERRQTKYSLCVYFVPKEGCLLRTLNLVLST